MQSLEFLSINPTLSPPRRDILLIIIMSSISILIHDCKKATLFLLQLLSSPPNWLTDFWHSSPTPPHHAWDGWMSPLLMDMHIKRNADTHISAHFHFHFHHPTRHFLPSCLPTHSPTTFMLSFIPCHPIFRRSSLPLSLGREVGVGENIRIHRSPTFACLLSLHM